MPLSCECYSEDVEWFYYTPIDYSTLKTSKRKRCCSCKNLINIGDTVLEFERLRYPISDIEERIYGEWIDVPLASWYMCEECSDIFYNLLELGFCIDLTDSMQQLLKQYREVYAKR